MQNVDRTSPFCQPSILRPHQQPKTGISWVETGYEHLMSMFSGLIFRIQDSDGLDQCCIGSQSSNKYWGNNLINWLGSTSVVTKDVSMVWRIDGATRRLHFCVVSNGCKMSTQTEGSDKPVWQCRCTVTDASPIDSARPFSESSQCPSICYVSAYKMPSPQLTSPSSTSLTSFLCLIKFRIQFHGRFLIRWYYDRYQATTILLGMLVILWRELDLYAFSWVLTQLFGTTMRSIGVYIWSMPVNLSNAGKSLSKFRRDKWQAVPLHRQSSTHFSMASASPLFQFWCV